MERSAGEGLPSFSQLNRVYFLAASDYFLRAFNGEL